jgi:hypothetical protein
MAMAVEFSAGLEVPEYVGDINLWEAGPWPGSPVVEKSIVDSFRQLPGSNES